MKSEQANLKNCTHTQKNPQKEIKTKQNKIYTHMKHRACFMLANYSCAEACSGMWLLNLTTLNWRNLIPSFVSEINHIYLFEQGREFESTSLSQYWKFVHLSLCKSVAWCHNLCGLICISVLLYIKDTVSL